MITKIAPRWLKRMTPLWLKTSVKRILWHAARLLSTEDADRLRQQVHQIVLRFNEKVLEQCEMEKELQAVTHQVNGLLQEKVLWQTGQHALKNKNQSLRAKVNQLEIQLRGRKNRAA